MDEEKLKDTEEREAILSWRSRVKEPKELANYWFALKQQLNLIQKLHLEYKSTLITILLRLLRGQEPLELQ